MTRLADFCLLFFVSTVPYSIIPLPAIRYTVWFGPLNELHSMYILSLRLLLSASALA